MTIMWNQMDVFVMLYLIHNWILRNNCFSYENKKNSLENGIKTSPSNLITGGYEKLTLGLPNINTYPCHRIGCTLSSPLVCPTFCTFSVLKRCMFSFPPTKIFPSYLNFTNYNHQKYMKTGPCVEDSRYTLASGVLGETHYFSVW